MSESMSAKNASVAAGCAGSLLKVAAELPLWLFILYSILQAIGASEGLWVAFWIYGPVRIVVELCLGTAKGFADKSKAEANR